VKSSSTLTGVDERERRMAQNEALFREVNERVEAVAHQLGPEVPYEFVCECANADCTFRLALSLRVYETIRSDPKQFVVLPLHYTPEVEDLVAEGDSYWIVRKSGEAGEYVEQLDPRGR
jgi:AraC-like DNA-binding protein